MQFPTVHLNGTSPESLIDGYTAALESVEAAIRAVIDTAPNGRDYYPKGPHAIHEATKEHADRVAKLNQVRGDLLALREWILDGGPGGQDDGDDDPVV
jgi:hypothetical protein